MPKAINNYSKEDVEAVSSWEDLKKIATLDHVKSALIARETQRIAHQRYTYKKALVLEKAKADMKANPDKWKDVQAKLDELS